MISPYAETKQNLIMKGDIMRKNFKCLSAILMTSVLAVSAGSMAMPAFADTITITPGVSTSTNHNYKAYQILVGAAHNDTLSNITGYGTNMPADKSALIAALKADTKFGSGSANKFYSLTDSPTANQFASAIASLSTDAEREEFAKVMGAYVSGDAVASDNSSPYELSVASGYYIIKDEATLGNGEERTLNLLKVAGTVAINAKENAPTSAKTVNDNNDSTGATETGKTTADYDIGDTVPYTLTFTLPSDYAKYEKYPVTFIDDMCAGLTLDTSSVKIWYGEVTGEGTSIAFTDATSSTASEYTSPSAGKVYKYEIADLKTSQPTFTSGTITIKYNATLNSSAVVGNAGNPNKYKVQFANDPNWYDDGDGGTQPDNPPTGNTPPKENKVYTYKVVLNKTDGTNALTGANFNLFKFVASTSGTVTVGGVTGEWVNVTGLHTGTGAVNPTKTGDTSGSTFTFSGIDDGHYKLVETATPPGYNSIDDIEFDITPAADGDLDDVSVTNLSLTADDTAGSLTGNVVNNQGVTLPSTGGMGTTVFYIVGGLLVAGALVLLIVKKRMNIKEK